MLQAEKAQSKAISVSIVVTIAVFLITLAAGIISDSVALLLDAAAEFVIVFTAFMLSSSLKKIHLPPDSFFNFGYEKFEPFTVVIQGAMMMLSCVIACAFAIQDIIHPENVTRYDIPMIASFLTGIMALLTAVYHRRVSIKTHSAMLKVSSLQLFLDTFLSLAMCIGFAFGLIMQERGFYRITPYVDPVMALILAVLFIWAPLKSIKYSVRELLDAAPAKNIREQVERIVERHKAKSFGIYSVRVRKAGEKIFLDVAFLIHGHTTTLQAREFAESFEKDIAMQFPKYDTIVYFYPSDREVRT